MAGVAGFSFQDEKRRRAKTSALIFLCVGLVYFAAVGALLLAGAFMFVPFLMAGGSIFSVFPGGLGGFLALSLGGGFGLGALHYYDARTNGARHIKEMLQAGPPDAGDRLHKRYANLVEEMAVANGLPEVRPWVLPSPAVNSMAIIESDGTPAILTSEGMLAECSRDELQAAVAHELAHILSGDAFYVTLVCSLAAFFENMKRQMEPSEGNRYQRDNEPNPGGGLPYVVAATASLLLRLLTTAISRQREHMADARAIDMTRNPMALARVIYKAHLGYSMMGDFSASYSPLFIVAPESEGADKESFFANLFCTHPPARRRIGLVASMAFQTENDVLKEVWQDRKKREAARQEIDVEPERGPSPAEGAPPAPGNASAAEERAWEIRAPSGAWEGPFSPQELLATAYFTPEIPVREAGGTGEMGPARRFAAVAALLKGGLGGGKIGDCPRCGARLLETTYEDAPLLKCPGCGGKSVDSRRTVNKILARKNYSFSKALRRKASDAASAMAYNIGAHKSAGERALTEERLKCPRCDSRMTPRPYNYQFFLPIDECLSCRSIWFDPDELEILQIWVERKSAEPSSID